MGTHWFDFEEIKRPLLNIGEFRDKRTHMGLSVTYILLSLISTETRQYLQAAPQRTAGHYSQPYQLDSTFSPLIELLRRSPGFRAQLPVPDLMAITSGFPDL